MRLSGSNGTVETVLNACYTLVYFQFSPLTGVKDFLSLLEDLDVGIPPAHHRLQLFKGLPIGGPFQSWQGRHAIVCLVLHIVDVHLAERWSLSSSRSQVTDSINPNEHSRVDIN